MYQYKAILKHNKEVISEGHSLEDVNHGIVRFKRGQKKGDHTLSNVQIEIYHILRDQVHGKPKEKLIKVV